MILLQRLHRFGAGDEPVAVNFLELKAEFLDAEILAVADADPGGAAHHGGPFVGADVRGGVEELHFNRTQLGESGGGGFPDFVAAVQRARAGIGRVVADFRVGGKIADEVADLGGAGEVAVTGAHGGDGGELGDLFQHDFFRAGKQNGPEPETQSGGGGQQHEAKRNFHKFSNRSKIASQNNTFPTMRSRSARPCV